jgi:hypothetical protein
VGCDVTAPFDPASVPDATAFLARLLRLDETAYVRLRTAGAGTGLVALWARLPWGVLVTRTVAAAVGQDATVRAADLLAGLTQSTLTAPTGLPARDGSAWLPARHDSAWRWPLPPGRSRVVERLPAAEVHRVAVAAAGTVRTAATAGIGGRPVGSRALRDALLDHVPIVVTAEGRRIEVPQRLVQAVVRMGFLGPSSGAQSAAGKLVLVNVDGRWVGLAADFGTAWHLPRAARLQLQSQN